MVHRWREGASRDGLGRLATATAFAVVFGLTTGWAAGQFRPVKRTKPVAGHQVFSPADLIKTDIWKTFGAKGAVVMVGDSHTEYADWPAMFPGVAIVNRGIGGDTTRAVLARLDTILSVSAATAFVTLGTNDILQGIGLDAIQANYRTILDRLAADGARVVVTSTPLTTSRKTNRRIAALNANIRAYCEDGARCGFVDLNAAIDADGLLSRDMTVDGIHLNGAGYAVWATMLAPYIRTETGASR